MSLLSNRRIDDILGNRKIAEQIREIQMRQAKIYNQGLDKIDKTMDIPDNIDYVFMTSFDEFNADLEQTNLFIQNLNEQPREKFMKNQRLRFHLDLKNYNKLASIFIIKSLPQQKKDVFYMKMGVLTDKIKNMLSNLSILIRQVYLLDDKSRIPTYMRLFIGLYSLYSIILRQITEKKIKPIDSNDLQAEENKIINSFGSDVMKLIKSYREIDDMKNEELQDVLADLEQELGRTMTQEELNKFQRLYADNVLKRPNVFAPAVAPAVAPAKAPAKGRPKKIPVPAVAPAVVPAKLPAPVIELPAPAPIPAPVPAPPIELGDDFEDLVMFGEGLKKKYQEKMDKIQKKKNKLKHDAFIPYDPRLGKNNF